MMRKFLCAVLVFVMLFSAAACNGGDDGDGALDGTEGLGADEKVQIQFAGWGDAKELENYQALVDQFMSENPNITVVYRGEGASTYMVSLKAMANNLPDLFYLPDYDFLEWVSNGKLMDITKAVKQEDLEKIWPQAVDEYYFNPDTMRLGKSEGAKLFGMPKDLGPFTLVYNKALLDSQITRFGLNSEQVYALLDPANPMSWVQFKSLLNQLDQDKTDSIYGISHYEIEAAVFSNNADFFDEGAVQQKITDPNFTEALQFVADLYINDKVMPSAADQIATNGYQRFKNSGSIFSFMGPWDCADFWGSVNFEFDVLPVPYNAANPAASSTAWVGSMAYCISAKASNSKAIAALKLAEYLSMSENGQRSFYSLGQQVPNIISMAQTEYLNDTNELLSGKFPSSRSVWIDTINGTSATDKIGGKVRSRYHTYSSDWYNLFTEYLTSKKMWDGNMSAVDTCAGFAPVLQEALDRMQANLG